MQGMLTVRQGDTPALDLWLTMQIDACFLYDMTFI
jgi:hypothetical protein